MKMSEGADHARRHLDEFADLHRVDEVHVEMHRRLRLLLVRVPGRHAERTVRERHDHAALHDAAAVVVLRLGNKRVAVALAIRLHPERADQADEAVVAVGFPAVHGRIELMFRVHGGDLAAWRLC